MTIHQEKPYEILDADLNPKSLALLVIDMQKHFSSMASPILPTVNSTIELCRAYSIPVFFTRFCHEPRSDLDMFTEWWDTDMIIKDGTPDSEFVPGLSRRDGDRVFKKATYSAFCSKELENALGDKGVGQVIISGVMTNLSCESSARDAYDRGFNVYFSADATRTENVDLQESTLKNIDYDFGSIVDFDILVSAFSRKGKA